MSDAKIAAAARRWYAVKLEQDALRKKRATFVCEREAHLQLTQRGIVLPCWKQREAPEYDEYGRCIDDGSPCESEFCPSCKERQAVYRALRVANLRHGAALRGLRAVLAHDRKASTP